MPSDKKIKNIKGTLGKVGQPVGDFEFVTDRISDVVALFKKAIAAIRGWKEFIKPTDTAYSNIADTSLMGLGVLNWASTLFLVVSKSIKKALNFGEELAVVTNGTEKEKKQKKQKKHNLSYGQSLGFRAFEMLLLVGLAALAFVGLVTGVLAFLKAVGVSVGIVIGSTISIGPVLLTALPFVPIAIALLNITALIKTGTKYAEVKKLEKDLRECKEGVISDDLKMKIAAECFHGFEKERNVTLTDAEKAEFLNGVTKKELEALISQRKTVLETKMISQRIGIALWSLVTVCAIFALPAVLALLPAAVVVAAPFIVFGVAALVFTVKVGKAIYDFFKNENEPEARKEKVTEVINSVLLVGALVALACITNPVFLGFVIGGLILVKIIDAFTPWKNVFDKKEENVDLGGIASPDSISTGDILKTIGEKMRKVVSKEGTEENKDVIDDDAVAKKFVVKEFKRNVQLVENGSGLDGKDDLDSSPLSKL